MCIPSLPVLLYLYLVSSDQSTVVAGGVTLFSLGDMIVYNRRKRKAYYEEQNLLAYQRLQEAKEAAIKGIATEEQILVLNRARAADEAEEVRKNKKTVWKSLKSVFSSEGLRKDDVGSATAGGSTTSLQFTPNVETTSADPSKSTILEALEEKRREGEKTLEDRGVAGGPLDKLAEQATSSDSSRGGWTTWFGSK